MEGFIVKCRNRIVLPLLPVGEDTLLLGTIGDVHWIIGLR